MTAAVSSVSSPGSFLTEALPHNAPMSSNVLCDLSDVAAPLDRTAGSVVQDDEKQREQMIRELFKKKENKATRLLNADEFSRRVSEEELRKDIDDVSKVVTDGELRSDVEGVTRVRREKLSTGTIEWRESSYPGLDIAGVYNPDTHKVEWRFFSYQGYSLGGVFNESTREIEWRVQHSRDYDMAGVYNPDAGAVEWQKLSYPKVRIAGVYCPSLSSPSLGEDM